MSHLCPHCQAPRNRIAMSPEALARAYERVQDGAPIKAVAIDAGIDVSTLGRHINRVERESLCMFYRCQL